MEKYDESKVKTFLFLIENSYFSNALIISSLLISFYNEKCIKETNISNTYKDLSERSFKPLISSSFLKECSNKLEFSNNEINKLDYLQKIKLVRNKLAHGDFIIDEAKGNIVVNLNIKGNEIETNISINSIISLAESLSEYHKYPLSKKRETIFYNNGIEYRVIDIPKTKYGRNSSYDKKLELVVNNLIYHSIHKTVLLPQMLFESLKLEYKDFNIEIRAKEVDTKREDTKSFENYMLYKLNNPLSTEYEGNEFIESLIDFYKYYVFPLENFLKVEDKNVMSLASDEMFNFESLIIANDNILKNIENIGKIRDYKKHFPVIENKTKEKYNKLVAKQNNPYYTDITYIETIKSELDNYLEFFNNSSIINFYPYSKKRSLIEHLRCSIEHGTYEYDKEKSSISFIDNWEGNSFNINMNTFEFMKIMCNENKKLILEQFKKVYNYDKKTILSR